MNTQQFTPQPYSVPFDAIVNNCEYILTTKNEDNRRHARLIKTYSFERENNEQILFCSKEDTSGNKFSFLVKNTAIRRLSKGERVQVVFEGQKALIKKVN